jgi:NADH:ubiquinone oxidoreductase subunit 6 (subunit J)
MVLSDVKTFLTVLIVLLMLGTLGVLFAGLVGLARGSPDPRRSNRLMRWRVILQGTVILLLLILMSLMRS